MADPMPSCTCGACLVSHDLLLYTSCSSSPPPLQYCHTSVIACGRLVQSHCVRLHSLVEVAINALFSPADQDCGQGESSPIWPRDGLGVLFAIRSIIPLAGAGLLGRELCARLMYIFLASSREREEAVQKDAPREPSLGSSVHDTAFSFAIPSYSPSLGALTEAVWLRLLLRCFQALTSTPSVVLARSCCSIAFVDALGVACFLRLSRLEHLTKRNEEDSAQWPGRGLPPPTSFSHLRGESTSSLPLSDAHLLFFGLQHWSLLQQSVLQKREGDPIPLPRTCSLLPSVLWGAVVSATQRAFIPRALSDHVLLVTALLRLLARAGVSDDAAAQCVATLQRCPLKVFGLTSEVYSLTASREIHDRLSICTSVTDYENGALEGVTSVQYLIDFSRLWMDGEGRHVFACAKNFWLCEVALAARVGKGVHSVLFLELQVPVRRTGEEPTIPFSDLRAYLGRPTLSQQPLWAPCLLRVRTLTQVGRGADFQDWGNSALRMVKALWHTKDWTGRLMIAQEAAHKLIEVVASMSDEECAHGTFACANGSGKWGITYMPGAMWQLRIPRTKGEVSTSEGTVSCEDVLSARLHVFEECAETVPHTHGIPFFSFVLRGEYVQTLWRTTNSSYSAQCDGSPSNPNDYTLPRRPPVLPSASVQDEHNFVAVRRPFRFTRPVEKVQADEHGILPPVAKFEAGKEAIPSVDNASGEVVEGRVQLQKSFFHTHRAGSVYFIGSQWIHTVDAAVKPGSQDRKIHENEKEKERENHLEVVINEREGRDGSKNREGESKADTSGTSAGTLSRNRVISIVFRTPTYFGAQQHATFFIPTKCICANSAECQCAALQTKTVVTEGGEECMEEAIDAAAQAAVRGTYGVAKEGTEEGADILMECRLACREHLARMV